MPYLLKSNHCSTIKIHHLKIVNQATNKIIPIDSLECEVVAKELLAAYAEQIGLPPDTRGTLTRKITRRQLGPDQTMRQAGLCDGETFDR